MNVSVFDNHFLHTGRRARSALAPINSWPASLPVRGRFDRLANDHNIFEELIDEDNAAAGVWADSAYRSAQNLQVLSKWGLREHLQRKGDRGRALSAREQQGNRTRSKIRSRVEHVFGVMAMRAGRLIVRTIGIARARCEIGLRNLAYNLDRYALLKTAHG